jgi:hypothetical protein
MRAFLAFLVLLSACQKRMPEAAYDDYDSYGSAAGMAAPAAPPAKSASGAGRGAARASAKDMPAMEESAPAEPETASAPAAARMVHYQGSATLRVGKPEETIEQAIALATAAGGGLEQQYQGTVVLKVPVAKFREVFDAVLHLGDVENKSISAEDVTEAFTAVELRLSTARARRDRLVALLAQSKEEAEKLALVKEIQAVTEEIDLLEQQSRTLQALADYSRITVQALARPVLSWRGGQPESAAFAWIRALTPFNEGPGDKKLTLPVPEGFVALDEKRRFVAESADGARIWSTRRVNDPIGDTAFWTDAVTQRLGGEFASAEPAGTGEWKGLRLVDRSDTPYVWVILIRAEGKDLDLVQVFYPSKDAEARYAPAVAAVLGGAS